MVLVFPDFEVLRIALTTGAVPASISRTAAVAGLGADGRLCVEPSARLPRASLAELRRLGVDCMRTSDVALHEPVCCWPQLLPLRRGETATARPEQTPVLFDLPAEQLGAVATEILRLGNDRQSFRVLAATDGKAERVLLRVVGPPYYTLLRALENGATAQPVAYVECAPRVWVQFGYRHALGEHFKPSAGKLLFMQPPRRWMFLDEGPFRDIYDVLDFTLPDVATNWRTSELPSRLPVPLRMAHAGGVEAAELWVLRDDPIGQLDDLVRSADDHLLARLAFAVGTMADRTIVVLRVRPSKLPPPVLVLNAVSCRPYLKLPNLFLPCGSRLHPPLRRDAVRRRLADDPSVITWLQPSGDGGFTLESLPDQAFRPLAEWVEYVLDHERQPLEQWMQSTLFDFESFVCNDDAPAKPKKPPTPERRRPAAPEPPPSRKEPIRQRPTPDEPKVESTSDAEEALGFVAPSKTNETRQRLDALEAHFLAVAGPLDAPERQALWPELAELNTALGSEDAIVCLLHALWSDAPPARQWAGRWLRAEASLARHHAEARAGLAREPAALTVDRKGEISPADLDRLLAVADPTTAEVRALAAALWWVLSRPSPPAAVIERLNVARQFLETHERLLPLRAAWLACTSAAKLAGGDVLALARARDRLLERLYQNGLRPEQELPSFLRFGGQTISHRYRAIRPWLTDLRELAGRCCQRMDNGRLIPTDRSQTPACLDLIFAFGLARLGETEAATRLQDRAAQQLGPGEAFHQFLLRAYGYRIRQTRDGKPSTGPLPDELLAYIAAKATSERLPYDRLRQTSRIVEPHQRVRWDQDYLAGTDPLAKALAGLPRILSRKELAVECRRLLHENAAPPPTRAHVLEAILEQAPRLGTEFAAGVLRQAVPAYDAMPPPQNDKTLAARAELLEKALYVAAHFDDAEQVQALVVRFQKLLHAPAEAAAPQALVALAGQSLRGLRKLGLRQEIELLLRQLEDVLLRGKKPEAVTPADVDGKALRPLLHLAAGWYYFGRDRDAEPIVDLARGVLLSGPLATGQHPKERAELACAYATTLGHAPLEFAQKRWAELFHKLESVATSWHTTPGYCALQVELVESVVLAVVSDDFTQGTEMRRWLDDDEYLIRKRIHADVRAMMARTDA